MTFNLKEHPHRRYNALTGDWILISPHRTKRPWQGQIETVSEEATPSYDPGCFLCPGNRRKSGDLNPQYESTFVFTNDFAALLPDTPMIRQQDEFFTYESVRGTGRVICFSPRHDKSLPEFSVEEIVKVVQVWIDQINDLRKTFKWIQIFENRGAMMGASSPHPHGQLWAGTALPREAEREARHQKHYFERYGSNLLCDYLEKEKQLQERVVIENDNWVVLVPFWAVWPYETLLLPRRHVAHLTDLTQQEQIDLADILKRFITRYDNMFKTAFPYSMGWHGHPFNGEDTSYWQLHAHFYPPLLRSATIRKFMVGYELLAEAQRDLSAEVAAETLRSLSEVHYRLA